MKKTKYSWWKRWTAVVLIVGCLLQLLPAETITAVAEAAERQTETEYTPGDVNGDGRINALDATLMRRHIAGGYGVQINALAADVNADGYVTAADVTSLRRSIADGYGVTLQRGLDRFTVRFETGGGNAIADQVILEGTRISTLSKPVWTEHIFAGWCYDAERKQPVTSTDTITENTTLYANWLEQAPLDTIATVDFAGAEDVSGNFAITVLSSDPEMTAEDVLAALDADDLTDPDADVEDIITVSGSEGTFTVSGKGGDQGGFKEGGSYRITLNDDKLTFKDEDPTARQFNFTVHREQVMNLAMQGDIFYLPVTDVSNIINNGEGVSTLSLSLYETDGENVTITDLAQGSFTYSGSTVVQVGDIVCIYEGALPTERDETTPKDQLGDMAYLEITGVDGTTYTYESAEAEEVLFMPDVLPMPAVADTDGDANNNTITVENKYLDYSADLYAYMNLDSQTTPDAGDFFAFYTGELGEQGAALTGYGRIAAVTDNNDGTTTIAYTPVTWAEVESTMDVYAQETMTGEELLEGMDTATMEAEIEQQALDSGFADEAAMYLASLALATDNF